MHHLYIIKSLKKQWFYIGISKDLQKRLLKHNTKSVRSTKAYVPLEIVYTESFENKTLARKREIELKKNNKKREILLQSIIKNSGINNV